MDGAEGRAGSKGMRERERERERKREKERKGGRGQNVGEVKRHVAESLFRKPWTKKFLRGLGTLEKHISRGLCRTQDKAME